MRTLLTFLFLAMTACDNDAELCAVMQECAGWNDREYDECQAAASINSQYNEEHGCQGEHRDQTTCSLEEGSCDEGVWVYEDVCADEIQAWKDCAGSAHD